MLTRREAIAAFAAATAQAATRLPANQNIKWACSAALWGHFKRVPLTEILDIMKDTGFIGIRVSGFPAFLETYGHRWMVDRQLCDFFGYNVTWNTNGFLLKLSNG